MTYRNRVINVLIHCAELMSLLLRSLSLTTPPPPPHWLTAFLQEGTKWKRVWWQMWVHIHTLAQHVVQILIFLIWKDHIWPIQLSEVSAIQTLLWGFLAVFQVALPHSLPLPRRETLQQSSSLSTVSPATVDLTLKVHWCTAHYRLHYFLLNFTLECEWNITKTFVFVFLSSQMESARKAWENSPSLEKNSPVTSSSPITSCASSYSTFSSASIPQIPVASVTPSTSLSGTKAPSLTSAEYLQLYL